MRLAALAMLVATLAVSRLGILAGLFLLITGLGHFVLKIRVREFLKRIVFVIPLLLALAVFEPEKLPLVGLKTLNALGCAAIITNNFDVFALAGIMRRFHLPGYFIEIFLLAFRYSFTFVDEVMRLRKNLRLRGAFHRRHLWQAGFLGPIIGHFFLRSYLKSQRVHQAMKLRGYGNASPARGQAASDRPTK